MNYFFRFFVIVIVSNIFSFSQNEIVEHLNGTNIYDITSDGSTIWIATYGQGIFYFDKGNNKWLSYSTQNKNIENDFFYCIAASNDFVWAGSSEGLFILDRKKNQWKKRKFALGGELGNWIRDLAFDNAENMLYIGRFKNLTRLDVQKQKYEDFDLTFDNDIKSNNIKIIRIENENYIWFGTEAGVHQYDKKLDLNNSSSHQFIGNKSRGFRGEGDAVSVSDICFENNFIWFGTDEFVTKDNPDFNVGGIYFFNRRASWEKLDKRNGLPANGVFALEKTGNKIWASIYQFDRNEKKEIGKGIIFIDRVTKKITSVKPDDLHLNSNLVRSLFFDGENLWIGSDFGLVQLKISNPFAKWSLKKKSFK